MKRPNALRVHSGYRWRQFFSIDHGNKQPFLGWACVFEGHKQTHVPIYLQILALHFSKIGVEGFGFSRISIFNGSPRSNRFHCVVGEQDQQTLKIFS